VVHVIDAVIMPGTSVMDIIGGSADHDTLETALVAATLQAALWGNATMGIVPIGRRIVMGVLPLHSMRHALFLHNEVPGIDISDKSFKRIEKAGKDAHKAGIEIAAEISELSRELVAGLYFMPSFGRYETIGSVLEQIGLTPKA